MTGFVQSKSGRATSGTLTVTFTATPTNGNTLFAVFGTNSATAQSPPTGWTALRATNNGTNTSIYYWTKQAGASEPSAVAISPTAGNQWDLHICEVSGMSAPTLDKSAVSDSGASAVTTITTGPTGALTGTSDFVLAAVSLNGAVTSPSTPGYATMESTARMHTAWLIDSDQSSKSPAPTWTTAKSAVGEVVAVSPVAPTTGFTGWGISA